jgi:uncharacterized LabA/DUF88 family protein
MLNPTLHKTVYEAVTVSTTLSFESRFSKIPRTVIFIDQSNFYHACENIGIEPDYAALMCLLTPEQGNCEIRIYLGVYKQATKKQKNLNKELKRLGYIVVEKPIAVYKDGTKKLVGDDHELSCDLLEMVLNGEITNRDRVVLVSGDGDFHAVLERVKNKGIIVDLIAHKPSHHLKPFVGHITHLDRIKYEICQHKKYQIA